MMVGPTDYEYQTLKNQIDLMSAVSLLLSKAVIDEPKFKPLAEAIAKTLENDAKDTAEILK